MGLNLNIIYKDFLQLLHYCVIRTMDNILFVVKLQNAIIFRESLRPIYQNLYFISVNDSGFLEF